jgi:putative multiple sugar transport system ATP-binding protein
MSAHILQMQSIIKEFPGVKALDRVTFNVRRGEIHCLIGENGAGKSTLMKVLSGVYPHGTYSGDIILNEMVQKFQCIKDSEKAGIAIIYQELALVPYMSIYENIFLGNEIKKRGLIDWNESIKRAQQALKRVGLNDHPDTLIGELGVGKQQLIEIAKALAKNVKLLILDEPTAALNEDDSENLLKILKELKDEGITSILISHKLNEVMAVADTVTVLRDGQTIDTIHRDEREITEDQIVRMMVGRSLEQRYPSRQANIGEVILELENWKVFKEASSTTPMIKDATLHVKRGEIVGIAGLMGAGRTELAMSLFGRSYGSRYEGKMIYKQKEVVLKNPKEAICAGIAYVTEDRKEKGLILIDDIKRNISISSLEKLSHRGIIDENEEIRHANHYKDKMRIKTPSIEQKVGNLSGGNQQKVALSKWMLTQPELLIVDEPTRGIDVGAKYEIYSIMNAFVEQGNSIVMISSELPEILGMSDRVYVMSEGEIVAQVSGDQMTQEDIMKHSIGHGRKK